MPTHPHSAGSQNAFSLVRSSVRSSSIRPRFVFGSLPASGSTAFGETGWNYIGYQHVNGSLVNGLKLSHGRWKLKIMSGIHSIANFRVNSSILEHEHCWAEWGSSNWESTSLPSRNWASTSRWDNFYIFRAELCHIQSRAMFKAEPYHVQSRAMSYSKPSYVTFKAEPHF